MKWCFLILLASFGFRAVAQQENEGENPNSAALEDMDLEEEGDADNDYDLQQMEYLRKRPADLNDDQLRDLPLVDAHLFDNLRQYRKLLGDLVDVYELQAVPGFSADIIRKILPFVTVSKYPFSKSSLLERVSKGDQNLLFRTTYAFEKAKGFERDNMSTSRFLGSRPSALVRYRYQFKNLLQYGITIEKDVGETLLHNNLPQFFSFHFLLRRMGAIKTLAVGDFAINIGQGLIHWQGLAYKKSSGVINIKRQSEVIRPYSSGGEYNFNRGVAITLSRRNFDFTTFVSRRVISGNITAENNISSVITSGLFRTTSELSERNNISLVTTGASLKRNVPNGHVAANIVSYKYSLPFRKNDQPYNFYSMNGTHWLNYSLDYGYTYRNVHLFGEIAGDRRFKRGVVAGIITSLSSKADMSILFRDVAVAYQSVFGNAFTENTLPGNERGLYTGVSLKPSQQWRLDLYADLFMFDWLKFRLNSPAYGSAYLVQATFKPNKKTELYARVRIRTKPINVDDVDDFNPVTTASVPGHHFINSWRIHFSKQLNRKVLFRSRLELCRITTMNNDFPENGYLVYAELHYKFAKSPFSGNIRLTGFETSSYNTRIYSYENDLLFVNSVPALYGTGVRYYLNIRGKVPVNVLAFKALTANVKFASTNYFSPSTPSAMRISAVAPRQNIIKLQLFLTV